MGIYSRKLSKGVKFFFRGQYQNVPYRSNAIYLSRTEAKAAERKKLEEISEQIRNPKIDIKFIDLANERLDLLKIKKSTDYYKENSRYFKKAIAEWGDVYVSQITRKMVNDLLIKEAKRLQKSGKGNWKVNSMIRSLKSLFSWGISTYDLSIKNVAKIEFYPVDHRLKYIPTIEQIEEVKTLCNPRQRLLIDFIEQTGARIGEAIRLRTSDVHADYLVLYTRKSKNSNLTPRTVPRPSIELSPGKDRVFSEWNSYPRFLEDAVEKLGHPKWNWHNLRHLYASRLANAGETTISIMSKLGHNSIHTTMRYLRLLAITRT